MIRDVAPAAAAAARAAAEHFEARFTTLWASRDGENLTLCLRPEDVPDALRRAINGDRFMVVVVPLDEAGAPVSARHRPWSALSLSQQAALLTQREDFQGWLRRAYPLVDAAVADKRGTPEGTGARYLGGAEGADLILRLVLGVSNKSALDSPRFRAAADRFVAIQDRFIEATKKKGGAL